LSALETTYFGLRSMAHPINPLAFQNRDQWRRWLEENHACAAEAWLILVKKPFADQGLTLDAATEEAMCFGWVDSQGKRLDERRFSLRFTPRQPISVWSVSNIRRVEQLTAQGKMTPAGMQAVAEAQANGQWQAAIRREQVDVIPEELEYALRQTPGAREGYLALPPSRRKQLIYLLQSAKTETTRQRRIERIVQEALG
jgi:uncharacterized protein YdeI (YjbR/CyaY-like superfamily)